tara:strand:+ start:355 stop:462 length:108 start_codon:yes stop_codon:yes gene_type:complete
LFTEETTYEIAHGGDKKIEVKNILIKLKSSRNENF